MTTKKMQKKAKKSVKASDVARYAVDIRYSDEDGAFIARVPELPGCVADGETYQEAARAIGEAIDGWIETAQELGREVPEPERTSGFSGRVLLRLPRSLHRALDAAARLDDASLNQFMVGALSAFVSCRTVADLARRELGVTAGMSTTRAVDIEPAAELTFQRVGAFISSKEFTVGDLVEGGSELGGGRLAPTQTESISRRWTQ